MSDLDARKQGMRFEPVAAADPASGHKGPDPSYLLLGVYIPLITLGTELVARLCADTFFDPMPTWAHVLAVASVPAANLWLWRSLATPPGTPGPRAQTLRRLALASGAATAVAGFYAVVFLPLAPIAVVALILGIGLLPLSPLLALVASLKLGSALRARHAQLGLGRRVLAGFAVGVGVLLGLDVPPAATRLGVQWAASSDEAVRARGVALLRWLGDDDMLLRLCYDASGRPTGLLSGLVILGHAAMLEPHHRRLAQTPAQVREIYYRVHGAPFNAKPAPFITGRRSLAGELQWDGDHGGAQVGGRVRGLGIVSSRIDGIVRGEEATAYLEWIVEFRNASPLDRETRLQLLLPPGGVVSRATLWVNGEEREAAYGGRGEVRAAYERVAVQQRRDPLLVTTKGADRVLAQAFPVPRDGGTIKFKIGMTVPLELLSAGQARLALPAIVDRNFSFGSDVRHQVWIESRQPLAVTRAGLIASRVEPGLHRVSGEIDDAELSRTRAGILVDRAGAPSVLAARSGDGQSVVQDMVQAPSPEAQGLMLVIDGSNRVGRIADDVVAALDAIPLGAKVGLAIAGEPTRRLRIASWSDSHRRAATELIGTTAFVGGQDNAPALAEAMQTLEEAGGAKLVWIHGPQPIAFSGSAARLEQALSRLKRLPQMLLYATEPGPNEVLPDQPWAWGATVLPATGSVRDDLRAILTRELRDEPRLVARRSAVGDVAGAMQGSDHIVRLWARDRVLDLMRQDPSHRKAAIALAADQRLVTPVSGAVVLETKQQYDESRLTPVSQTTVPAVPEPHEWALIILALASLAWMAHRNRRILARA